MKNYWPIALGLVSLSSWAAPPTIPSSVNTRPFASYDEAPATVDADDPAIWVHPERPGDSLIVGTLKDAGLVVYDLRGRVVQLIAPPNLPTIDITADDVPRVYPWRVVQPSPIQPSELDAGLQANPLDDQDTGYGVGLWHDGDDLYAFVSQRNRSTVQQLKLSAAPGGKVTYRPVRAFLFDPNFRLKERGEPALRWTPCRENANEDPQSEGILIDPASETLYVAFETIGVYRIPLHHRLPSALRIGREFLFEPVQSFGKPYHAVPDDDEFECEYDAEGEPEDGTIVAAGSDAFAGANLAVDVEGLAFYETGRKSGYLVVSSQGDNTFHLYDRRGNNRHLGVFTVEQTGDSDGVAITSAALGRGFPDGIVAVQNGEAEDPANTDPINGFEYDGSTQFRFVDWRKIAKALRLEADRAR